jgi:murein DD-endopeptidase MepM/ murein hydrolase activator NlpD
VVKGVDVAGEIARIVEACRVPGVKSMILDVEPYEGYWEGSQNDVLQLMGAVRQQIGAEFHIGLGVDPRRQHYNAVLPSAWRPYVNSVHPYIYWQEMGRDPDDILAEAYVVWGGYGLPLIPVLQGDAGPQSLKEAQDLARSVRGAPGLSYFRLGTIGPLQFAVIKGEVVEEEIGPDRVIRRYGHQITVAPGDVQYSDGTHTDQPSASVFKHFTSVRGHPIKFKQTRAKNDQVWAQWVPKLPERGLYEISVYVPNRHATTHKARYHIHGILGNVSEVIVTLDQARYNNQWVPLVVYEFDNKPISGRVNLTDLTGEADKEIAFTAIRWRQVISQKVSEYEGVGFDPPIGTAEERLSNEVWPGHWFDATGYATFYTYAQGSAYHTGADLNKNYPAWDADRDSPVYAPADGLVTFSGRLRVWGQLIVIRHDPLPNGTVVWSRLAHVDKRTVREGDRVELGQQIAQVGNAEGTQPYHLHFDIAKTDVLERSPGHWPGGNRDLVYKHYVDPREFVMKNRPPGRQ